MTPTQAKAREEANRILLNHIGFGPSGEGKFRVIVQTSHTAIHDAIESALLTYLDRIQKLEEGLKPLRDFHEAVVSCFGDDDDPDALAEPITYADMPEKHLPTFGHCRRADALLKEGK